MSNIVVIFLYIVRMRWYIIVKKIYLGNDFKYFIIYSNENFFIVIVYDKRIYKYIF